MPKLALLDHDHLSSSVDHCKRNFRSAVETNSIRAPHICNRPKASTPVQISMAKKTFYLEAPARTQDLLAAQRALRSAGCAIGSTWHDRLAGPEEPGSDWIRERLEELKKCDALIVLCGEKQKAPLQVPLLAGYALTRGMRVIWIGTSVQIACRDRNVSQFNTIEEFCGSLALKLAA
jgi:hypothetical protein